MMVMATDGPVRRRRRQGLLSLSRLPRARDAHRIPCVLGAGSRHVTLVRGSVRPDASLRSHLLLLWLPASPSFTTVRRRRRRSSWLRYMQPLVTCVVALRWLRIE